MPFLNFQARNFQKEDREIHDAATRVSFLLARAIENGVIKEPAMNCHIMARVMSRLFPLRLVDGAFVQDWDVHGAMHSWCLTESGEILDPWPLGFYGSPILVWRKPGGNYLFSRYIDSPQISKAECENKKVAESVEEVIEALRTIGVLRNGYIKPHLRPEFQTE